MPCCSELELEGSCDRTAAVTRAAGHERDEVGRRLDIVRAASSTGAYDADRCADYLAVDCTLWSVLTHSSHTEGVHTGDPDAAAVVVVDPRALRGGISRPAETLEELKVVKRVLT
jgi:hypothetical protein